MIYAMFFVFVKYHDAYSTEQADQIADHILDRLVKQMEQRSFTTRETRHAIARKLSFV